MGPHTTGPVALLVVLLMAVGGGCGGDEQTSPAGAGSTSGAPEPTSTPDADQLEAEIDEYVDLIGATDALGAVVVARGDAIVLEQYRSGGPDAYWDVQSVTKSVVSTLIGIALAEGLIGGLEVPLATLLPAQADLMSPAVAATTLHELLTMTAGLAPGDECPAPSFTQQPRWVEAVLTSPESTPGGPFGYSNGTTHVLAAILQEAVGTTALDYARSRLFDPLGIDTRPALQELDPQLDIGELAETFEAADFAWPRDPQGISTGWWGLRLRPLDMVRLGQLFLAGGRWEGEQLVPEAWVREATSPQVETQGDGHGYGYQWWTATADGDEAFMAVGWGGQMIEVVPDRDLVVVTTARTALDDPAERGVDTTVLASLIEYAVVAQYPAD